MSSREPDNSQLRDPLMAKLMAESLASAVPGASCPDAETVAAYAERNLSSEETAQLDVHFADCARCHTVLAAFARSLDSLPASVTAESVADGAWPKPANIQPRTLAPASKIRSIIRTVPPPQPTRWSELAPALGIAAAIALWFALRPAPPTQNLSAQIRTDAETAATQLQAAPAPALSDKDIANPNTAGADNSAAVAPSPATPPQPVPPPPPPQEQQLSTDALASNASREDALKKFAPAEETANAPATALGGTSAGLAPRKELRVSQSAPAPSAPPASAPNSGTGETSSATLRAPLPAAAQKSAAPQTPGGGIGGAAPAASIAPATERAKPAVAIDTLTSPATVAVTGDLPIISARQLATFAAPGGTVTWRIGARGSIERSTDRGQTWEKQISGVFGDLTAGLAISNDVAWIVGRAGIILRTSDGVHWQRVSLPPAIVTIMTAASPAATSSATDSAATVGPSAKSDNAVSSGPAPSGTAPPSAASAQSSRAPLDLAAVTATDALHATVVSGAGRRFTTSDGGQTWVSQ
jgi:hypothetical protein